MAVYVDPLNDWGFILKGRPRQTCHMVADTDGELHRMARRMGVNPAWFRRGDDTNQYRRHYEITAPFRHIVLRNGATPVSHRQLATMIAQARKKVTT